MSRKQIIGSLILIPLVAGVIAWCGSQYGQNYGELSIFAWCIGLAFLINWLAFVPAFLFQTEKFFDLTGSLTYISIVCLALYLSDAIDTRSIIIALAVIIWAVRLGSFLFKRIAKDGKDDRFDELKPNFFTFLNVWSLQALWVTFTAMAAIICITSIQRVEITWLAYFGLSVWIIGFAIEIVADYQKRQFKKNAANKGRFIQSGLWSRSRHPNYFGEILLWIGIFIICIPILQGLQWVAILSPAFVYLLLTKVSGIPLLEAKAEKKWGGEKAYENYKVETPILIPKF